MKFIGLIVLVFSSASALAVDASLVYTSTNGTVSPRYRSRSTCTIIGSRVSRITLGGFGNATPRETRTGWTAGVRNSQAIVTLLQQASRGRVSSAPGPIGGGTQTYEGILSAPDARYAPVRLLSIGGVRMRNSSRAAQVLVDFINYNCNQQ